MSGILQSLLASIGGAITDAYFNLVTLLLPGNGTNGAQNNTFLDSSTNNFTITRNGNTTQGTFSPFSQTGWGNYFGSSDKLSFGTSTNLALGSGDWTVECWYFPTTSGAFQVLFDWRTAGNSPAGIPVIGVNSTNFPYMEVPAGTTILTSSVAVTVNAWNHVTFTRASNTLRVFVNGVSGGSATNTTNLGIETLNMSLSGAALVGYVSNARIVKGTAVYTSAFTVPTSPLTAITNTQLLTCQSNRFIDNSTNAFAITVNGTPSVQAFSPFAPTAAYSAATNGGSGYFDGAGDYLTVSSSNQILPTGTQDYCIEFWAYTIALSGSYPMFLENSGASGFQFLYFNDGGANQNKISVGQSGTGAIVTATFNTQFRQWAHVVATRSGNAHRLFINGVLQGYASNSVSFGSISTQGIGAQANGSNPVNAYMCGLRTTLGSIPTTYQTSSTTTGTSIFTPPSTPPTTTSEGASSPAFLANFTNAGITDATAKNDLETVSNAQISTAQSKFGGSSMYFDGTGDYLVCRAAPVWLFSGDWTMEAWIYPTSVTGVRVIFDTRNRTTNASPVLYTNGSNLVIDTGTAAVISAGTIVINTWQHVAATRSGNSWRLFINGTQVGTTTTNTTAYSTAYGCCIGSSNFNEDFAGYIDDARITQGYARYTANFTAPTAAFALQ